MIRRAPTRWGWLAVVLAAYLLLSLVVLHRWQDRHWYPVTGDEPSYLVMSSGIIHQRTLDQRRPMEQEFADRKVDPTGLAPPGATPTLANAQVVVGPHGDFSVHGPGLPALLVPGFLAGGDGGAKVEMVLLAGVVVAAIGYLALWRNTSAAFAVAAGLVACCGVPLLTAAGQVYPDVPAGAISLLVLVALTLSGDRPRPVAVDVGLAVLLAFQPWLQVKFALPALIGAGALALQHRRDGARGRLVVLVVLLGASLVALGTFDRYAYGNVFGPYDGSDGLQLSWNAVMVFLGLHIDRLQGILVQCPLLLVGVYEMVRAAVRGERWAVFTVATYLGFVVPNALHPNLYGGASFAGRFAWSGGVVLLLPTVIGLARLARARRGVAWAVVIGEGLLQAWFFAGYVRHRFDWYNQAAQVWVGDYPSLWGRAARYLPALYDRAWAFGFAANWAGAALLGLLVLAGAVGYRRLYPVLGVPALGAYLGVAATGAAPNLQQTYPASTAPSLTGHITGSYRVATPPDVPTYVTYGDPGELTPGVYALSLQVGSSLPPGQVGGTWDVYGTPGYATTGVELATGQLHGSAGRVTPLAVTFDVPPTARHWEVQVRTVYSGAGTLEIGTLTLDKLR